MPGYLVTPSASASGVSISPIAGLTSGTVQAAISELLNKNTSVELKSVNVYSTAVARSTALPSPTIGQVTYITTTKSLEAFDGTGWVGVALPDDYNLVVAQRMFTE